MKICIETATGASRTVPDDYLTQQGEILKALVVEDAPAEGVSTEEASVPDPEEEAEEEEDE